MFPVKNLSPKISVKLRSSLPEVFYKQGVTKHFAKFRRKHLCRSLLFGKATLLKWRLQHRRFHVNFDKVLRTPLHAVAASENSQENTCAGLLFLIKLQLFSCDFCKRF